ncbi:MAG: 4-hydroxy-tetrahydrodipicolinate reductase [Pirellulales bacterium]
MAIRIAINGAAGRMGGRLVALASDDADLKIVAALEHASHPKLGADAGLVAGVGEIGVPLSDSLPEGVDVVIDFSVPLGTAAIVATCRAKKIPLVVATTGLEADSQDKIRQAAGQIPVLWAPNMSLAVNLAMKLAETAARTLKDHPSGADVEIIERHHRFKEDAPSGTALKFGEIIAAVMGQTQHRHGRSGRPGKRPHGEVGYHSLRTGDNPGEHTIIFGLVGETLELSVRAANRDCYAHGALAAAKFLAGKPPGLYSMNDVLGL